MVLIIDVFSVSRYVCMLYHADAGIHNNLRQSSCVLNIA